MTGWQFYFLAKAEAHVLNTDAGIFAVKGISGAPLQSIAMSRNEPGTANAASQSLENALMDTGLASMVFWGSL
jgi:hypothetical protein